MMCYKRQFRSVVCILLALSISIAYAGGVEEIEEGLPLSVDQAYPIPYLAREVQVILEYRRGRAGQDAFLPQIGFEFGFPRNGEIKLRIPFAFGDDIRDGFDDISAHFLYNFNQETMWIPAFALEAGLRAPTNRDSRGFDPTAKFLATSTMTGRSNTFQQLHFNYLHVFNADRRGNERDFESEVILGYSRRINSQLLFVTNVLRRWALEKDVEENIAEFGLRYQVAPLSILSFGIGFGFGDDSPDMLVRTGLQVVF